MGQIKIKLIKFARKSDSREFDAVHKSSEQTGPSQTTFINGIHGRQWAPPYFIFFWTHKQLKITLKIAETTTLEKWHQNRNKH